VKISFLFRGAKAEELLERGFKVKEYELRKENFSGKDNWHLNKTMVLADPDPAFSDKLGSVSKDSAVQNEAFLLKIFKIVLDYFSL
jgi:hypothetical protein